MYENTLKQEQEEIHEIKIISHKCQSLNANLETVSSLLNICDIFLLQKTQLNNDNSAHLKI